MLLTIYILFQITAIIALIFVFVKRMPLLSVLTLVLSGFLMVGAWTLEIGSEYIWDNAIKAYSREPLIINTPYLAYINMIIFVLALIYFFYDIFMIYKEESRGLGDVKPNDKGNGGMI